MSNSFFRISAVQVVENILDVTSLDQEVTACMHILGYCGKVIAGCAAAHDLQDLCHNAITDMCAGKSDGPMVHSG